MTDLIEIAKSGGPVTAVTIVFLYFNNLKDKRISRMTKGAFKETIKVVKKNTKAFQETTDTLVHLTDSIKKFNGFKKDK